MAKEPKKSEPAYGSGMTDEGTGIGTNVVERDAPPYRPTVIDADGNVVDLDSIDDD